jgi:transposase
MAGQQVSKVKLSRQHFGGQPTMTKLSSTPADAVLIAIDMAKNRQEVLIERPEGGRRRRMTVLATKADYDRLAEQLAAIGRPIVIGFEATGNYHRTLAHRLLAAGFELRLISSVALARTREALHNGWDKNDPKDAQVILHMLRIGATQRYVDPLAAGTNDLQELSKTHETISRMKTQTWHRILTHYLPLYFPEIARFAGNSRSGWFLALIERFPTPTSITTLDREAFSAAAWPLIGRKVSKARLINDIYETACASVALPVPEESAAITMFRMVIAQGRSLIHQRDEIERLAHTILAEQADLPVAAQHPRHRPDQRANHPCRGGRSAPLQPSSPVPEVLRPRSRDLPVRDVPRPHQAVQVRQRSPAPHLLDGRPGRRASARQQLPRQARTIYRRACGRCRPSPQGDDGAHRQDGARGSRRRQDGDRVPAVPRTGGCQVEGPLSASAVRAHRATL